MGRLGQAVRVGPCAAGLCAACRRGPGGRVIRSAFAEPLARQFHLFPFKRLWQSTSASHTERVYDELYTSDAWLQAHDDLQRQPPEPGCQLERVIAGLMFWSDSMRLANFGSAKAWPIYLYFGNLSKYIRACPSKHAGHHVAYIPSSSALLTHCCRELFHAIWKHLLDADFVHAYKHGIVIQCADGVWRRVYPRIFTYSADYPKKVLIATLRDNGQCPCPRCLTLKTDLWKMGYKHDLRCREAPGIIRTWTSRVRDLVLSAREGIYQQGLGVTSAAIQRLSRLENAFTSCLGDSFDVFSILPVDFMHEVELGVWKALFTHLIRILYAVAPSGQMVVELNHR
ncbi:hypothetical protein POSPLADRAFT_1050105 [Postia placenta MAD-698-R-SB12]|uniref:Uncharacterized protein n=1 Tax=Postia placenta MAD-698-R-SB12 TaxID=670580 RepID=A0A1X6MMJ7_9APHY|nr:hypothetical protein POSPLADRAFT_1050105 [Postia placenta MAD-698-R-SB12]OSX57456.1 hypothetical protein POSPLADRAFT_1050105 [Postia placenta MAD-698-R-SB12]